MVDPVQAMLLDMIPSLEPKTENSMILDLPVPKRESPTLDPNPGPSVPKRENPALDPNPGPSKKKKVIYRDLAMELLEG